MNYRNYQYQLFYPVGNDTAIVFGIEYNNDERKRISDAIMEKHKNIEQVGFVSIDSSDHIFFMAGGGFCGNGTRAAIWHFLHGEPSTIHISIPNVGDKLNGGITEDGSVWTEVPMAEKISVTPFCEGMQIVEMVGVAHIVVSPEVSASYLKLARTEMLDTAENILKQTSLFRRLSCGVIFTDRTPDGYRIVPCVHDFGVNTMFQETACGTGSIAVAIKNSMEKQTDISIAVKQPSGDSINATAIYGNGRIQKAIISGPVRCDAQIFSGFIIL